MLEMRVSFSRRQLATTFMGVVLLSNGGLAAPKVALALSCTSPSTTAFGGTQSNHTNAVRGAKAKIEYVNPALCTTAGDDDFSSYWAAIVGYDGADANHYNIYQIGVDKCRNGACAATSPQNQAYYFWAFGRMASSACGSAIGPEPHFIANAATTDRTYKIVREYLMGAGNFYNLYIDSTAYQKWYKTEFSVDTCWNGIDGGQFYDELYEGQSGGTSADHQDWTQVYWYTGSAWQSVTSFTGSSCETDRSYQRCLYDSFDPSIFRTWDTRY